MPGANASRPVRRMRAELVGTLRARLRAATGLRASATARLRGSAPARVCAPAGIDTPSGTSAFVSFGQRRGKRTPGIFDRSRGRAQSLESGSRLRPNRLISLHNQR
jgi:hypothetical protein